MATFHDLTSAQLKQAIQLREQIEVLQAKLNALLGGTAPDAKSGDFTAGRTKPAASRGGTGTAPVWRFAHVRSPLDTLMDAAPTKKGGPRR